MKINHFADASEADITCFSLYNNVRRGDIAHNEHFPFSHNVLTYNQIVYIVCGKGLRNRGVTRSLFRCRINEC